MREYDAGSAWNDAEKADAAHVIFVRLNRRAWMAVVAFCVANVAILIFGNALWLECIRLSGFVVSGYYVVRFMWADHIDKTATERAGMWASECMANDERVYEAKIIYGSSLRARIALRECEECHMPGDCPLCGGGDREEAGQ